MVKRVLFFNNFNIYYDVAASSFMPRVSFSAGFKAPELDDFRVGKQRNPGTLESMKGKVVVIDFFQMWCPGCNSFALPLMNQAYRNDIKRHDDDIVFLFVHTVFEGHCLPDSGSFKRICER